MLIQCNNIFVQAVEAVLRLKHKDSLGYHIT